MINRRIKYPRIQKISFKSSDQQQQIDYSWSTLSSKQYKKCEQKFDYYKPSGCDKLSRYQLERMMKEIGKNNRDEDIGQMVWEGGGNGEGFIGFEGFVKRISRQKQKKYEQVVKDIQLTFDSILNEERIKKKDLQLEEITWEFLKQYLVSNYQIQININCLVGKKSINKGIKKNQFMSIFS